MLVRRKILKLFPLITGFVAMQALAGGKAAIGQTAGQASSAALYNPESPKVAAGEVDVKQLVFLMDADKNGKISKKEFMDFMSAEFDRLDTDKSGELDLKELEQSQITATHHGGTHR